MKVSWRGIVIHLTWGRGIPCLLLKLKQDNYLYAALSFFTSPCEFVSISWFLALLLHLHFFNMRFFFALVALESFASSTILWDGRFNTFTSSADLLEWSWSNEVGSYQYYIASLPIPAILSQNLMGNYQHGSENVTSYINLSSSYKNPADSGSSQGAKFTLDSTAYWNGQNMRRIELIPQTTAAINSGKVWYHFSIMKSSVNPPSIYREHQICFFESHFTELKAGWISGESGTSDPLLRWDISGTTHWSVNWDAGIWHNIAYEIVRYSSSFARY